MGGLFSAPGGRSLKWSSLTPTNQPSSELFSPPEGQKRMADLTRTALVRNGIHAHVHVSPEIPEAYKIL